MNHSQFKKGFRQKPKLSRKDREKALQSELAKTQGVALHLQNVNKNLVQNSLLLLRQIEACKPEDFPALQQNIRETAFYRWAHDAENKDKVPYILIRDVSKDEGLEDASAFVVGQVHFLDSADIPEDNEEFLPADGREVTQEQYPDLFVDEKSQSLLTKADQGDGTFKYFLPDLIARTINTDEQKEITSTEPVPVVDAETPTTEPNQQESPTVDESEHVEIR